MKRQAFGVMVALGIAVPALSAQSRPSPPSTACQIRSVRFDGWNAEEVANRWVRLTFVPQLGGRLMQVTFNGHPYLFVNPKYEGKYVSPAEAAGRWINYGGDKVWPMPEGSEDEQHWTLASTPLDDGPYVFTILAQKKRCTVRLQGPPDPPTGLQYTREISIGSDSPEISFHAIEKNYTGHTIAWSMQSVSQYNLADDKDASQYNHNFWAFTPINRNSSYLNGYNVQDGLANDPSFSVKDGLFRLNWRYLQNEVWIDSSAGWIALVDGTSQYAMVEKFDFMPHATYPGKASVIFYKNGPAVQLDGQGMPFLTSQDPSQTPYYMEAELNSPIAVLAPGATYAMDTFWFPSRMDKDLHAVTDAGMIGEPLVVTRDGGKLDLKGSFGAFFPGKLVAYLYNRHGVEKGKVMVQAVTPRDAVDLNSTVAAPADIVRVSLHLVDNNNLDRGSLGEVLVTGNDGGH